MKVEAIVTPEIKRDVLILRERIGNFDSGEGHKGEISLGPSGPVIEVGNTYVIFSWQTLLNAAYTALDQEEGIEDEN